MSSLPAIAPDGAKSIEAALMFGDVSKLSSEMKLDYYKQLCASMGLNPLTRPFEWLRLNGKETLYAGKNCAEQLRKVHHLSITITAREKIENLYIITARATGKDGRTDESTAAIDLGRLSGENLANALMKCETKAKRRVTLSFCGLGMLDESEVESVPGAVRVKNEPELAIVTTPAQALQEPVVDLPEPLRNPFEHVITTVGSQFQGKRLIDAGTEWIKAVVTFPKKLAKYTPEDRSNLLCAASFSDADAQDACQEIFESETDNKDD